MAHTVAASTRHINAGHRDDRGPIGNTTGCSCAPAVSRLSTSRTRVRDQEKDALSKAWD